MKTYRIFATKHLASPIELVICMTEKEIYSQLQYLAFHGYTEIISYQLD